MPDAPRLCELAGGSRRLSPPCEEATPGLSSTKLSPATLSLTPGEGICELGTSAGTLKVSLRAELLGRESAVLGSPEPHCSTEGSSGVPAAVPARRRGKAPVCLLGPGLCCSVKGGERSSGVRRCRCEHLGPETRVRRQEGHEKQGQRASDPVCFSWSQEQLKTFWKAVLGRFPILHSFTTPLWHPGHEGAVNEGRGLCLWWKPRGREGAAFCETVCRAGGLDPAQERGQLASGDPWSAWGRNRR